MWSDGGGKASAARRPLIGRDQVLNFLIGLHGTGQTTGLAKQAKLNIEDVNSEPALVLRIAGHLESIFVISVEDDRISGIRVVRNPDKLARIDRQLALGGGAQCGWQFPAPSGRGSRDSGLCGIFRFKVNATKRQLYLKEA
jgi:RNA polymerase sigma-70 factor (ECF subfamily)